MEPRRPALPVLPARTELASSSEDDDDLSVDGNNVSRFYFPELLLTQTQSLQVVGWG